MKPIDTSRSMTFWVCASSAPSCMTTSMTFQYTCNRGARTPACSVHTRVNDSGTTYTWESLVKCAALSPCLPPLRFFSATRRR